MKKALSWRSEYYYDSKIANRMVKFFPKMLVHVEGELSGQPFILQPWQQKIVRRLFGWLHKKDGTRKYRTLFVFVPRKMGKSTFVAGLAVLLLHADGEKGGQIISAAADKDQARIIFGLSQTMNDHNPKLKARTESYKSYLKVPSNGTVYKVVSSDVNTKHGYNLSAGLIDELHAQKTRDLYDVIKTSMGARRQPLLIMMSTAGHDMTSICYEVYKYAKAVDAGEIDDPSFYPVIYEASPDDDWRTEAAWKKANPNYGISVMKEYYEQQVRDAIYNPAYENTFKRLHLNMWTNQDIRAINMEAWARCGNLEYDLDSLKGKVCYAGLDLSASEDLSSLSLVFKEDGLWKSIIKCWCPKKTLIEKARRGNVPWDVWVRQGHLISVPGGRIDYDLIRLEIQRLATIYQIKEIAVDPWNAHHLTKQLMDDGFKVIEVRQGLYTLNAPTKEFIASISNETFAHGNHPVFTWNASNFATEEDAAGNLKPAKNKAGDKIDICVATITALSRAILSTEKKSIYEDRGFMSF